MKIGCFALVEPFSPMKRQFMAIREMGIDYADLTDNHNGGMLGVEYGFTASISLDCHPETIRRMVQDAQITLTSVCAHANLLDPPGPDIYGTNEIIKAIRLASALGIKQVITTEGDPKTDAGHRMSQNEKIFTIAHKLYWPVRWAQEHGIELLIEPHGCVTDTIDGMQQLLHALGHENTVGICLDTGNSWLGGSEPMDYIQRFGQRIKHVHWKDLGSDWIARRGTLFGCGMGTLALGDGIVGIERIVKALKRIGFDGPTTLEIAGKEAVCTSKERIQKWIQE